MTLLLYKKSSHPTEFGYQLRIGTDVTNDGDY